MKIINVTPHAIVLNDGTRFEPSGTVARVGVAYSPFVGLFTSQVFGEVQDLPEEAADTVYIVSAMVLSATSRQDVIAPATGHPGTVRNEKGHIVSVPGFVRNV